jgi:glycerol transport system ATP-binding protein
MQLKLEGISKRVGAAPWLYEMDLAPQPGAVTVLLGATQAGKTSLMRIMAGLDTPSTGRVRVDGQDVTGLPVRKRNVAMVYQQFINYPSMTVYDNIASPLRLGAARGRDRPPGAGPGRAAAHRGLPRAPAGRALRRPAAARRAGPGPGQGAPLMLLDEPLVNLDYKLREELREELCQLFASGESTVVYATTEPAEALLLGGWTAVMDQGELLQYGPTAEVFHHPRSIRVARAFSDPPMNLLAAQATEAACSWPAGRRWPWPCPHRTGGADGGRARQRAARGPRAGDVALPGSVELAEISGSDTFVHVQTAVGELVAQLTGVHEFDLGAPITLHASPAQVHVFDARGELLLAPQRPGGR